MGHVLGRHHSVHSAYGIIVDGAQQYKRGQCEEEAENVAPDYPMDQHQDNPLSPTLGPMSLGDYRLAFGWDSSDRNVGRPLGVYVSPYQTADLMSYCEFNTRWTWPGIHTYTNLLRALIERFGARGAAPAPGSPRSAPIVYLVISGLVEATTPTVFLDPILHDVRVEPPESPEPGPYAVRLLDGAGGLLGEVPFMPEFPPPEENESRTLSYGYFVFHVARPEGLGAVEIMRDGLVLDRRAASAHAPSVQFISPLGGVVASNEPISMSWIGSDLDGDPLTYTLEFSANDGRDYAALAFDLRTNVFEIPAGTLRGSSNGRLRVTASDGLNVSSAETSALQIPGHAPEVEILQPVPNQVFVGNETVILRARAWDAEDGDLSGAGLRWSSDRVGDLGTGEEVVLDAASLAEGDHQLSVAITDSAGQLSAAHVPVNVQRRIPVTLNISRDGDEIKLSWPASASVLRVWAAFSVDSSN